MTQPRVWLLAAVVAAVSTAAVAWWWRHFPLLTALLSGLAVGVLVFTTLQTVERLRRQFSERE